MNVARRYCQLVQLVAYDMIFLFDVFDIGDAFILVLRAHRLYHKHVVAARLDFR